jgi:hypothetical protein
MNINKPKEKKMTHLKLVENDNNAASEAEVEESWAEIQDGKLVKFDNAACRKLAAAFDSGNREPGNEVAKLCVLLVDAINEYIVEESKFDSGYVPISDFSIGLESLTDGTKPKDTKVEVETETRNRSNWMWRYFTLG